MKETDGETDERKGMEEKGWEERDGRRGMGEGGWEKRGGRKGKENRWERN